EALKLLELPRELGLHPESAQPIVAGLGRFGPYVKHGDDYRSLEATDDLFTVDLERAVALFNAPKRSQRQAAKRVIRTIEIPGGETVVPPTLVALKPKPKAKSKPKPAARKRTIRKRAS